MGYAPFPAAKAALASTLALAVVVLVGLSVQGGRARPAAMAGGDVNTYPDWLKTLSGPASYSGIGEETSDFGASQHNSKKGERELMPGALPGDAKIAQMQGADFAGDVYSPDLSGAGEGSPIDDVPMKLKRFKAAVAQERQEYKELKAIVDVDLAGTRLLRRNNLVLADAVEVGSDAVIQLRERGRAAKEGCTCRTSNGRATADRWRLKRGKRAEH